MNADLGSADVPLLNLLPLPHEGPVAARPGPEVAKAPPQDRATPRPETEVRLAGGPKGVLVVEDDRDLRDCLEGALSDLGYQVHTACDGAQGLQEALRLRPDAIVADLGLPLLPDGFELGRQLRAALPAVRLVALSGYRGVEDQAQASGFDCCLLKPVSLKALLKALGG